MNITKIEARILGTLIEKEVKRPDRYPLTLRDAWSGCNQTTGRVEIIYLSIDEVEANLQSLVDKGYVKQVQSQRTTRWAYDLPFVPKAALPAFSQLLLRGPQSANQLRHHVGMLTWMPEKHFVKTVLSNLPFIKTRLGYRQREERYQVPFVG